MDIREQLQRDVFTFAYGTQTAIPVRGTEAISLAHFWRALADAAAVPADAAALRAHEAAMVRLGHRLFATTLHCQSNMEDGTVAAEHCIWLPWMLAERFVAENTAATVPPETIRAVEVAAATAVHKELLGLAKVAKEALGHLAQMIQDLECKYKLEDA